jgi:CBS domain-containing protein
VLEGGVPVGLLPFSRVAEVPREEWDNRVVRERMLALEEVPLFRPDDLAIDAAADLSESRISRGLVIERERLVGLVSVTDLLRMLRQAEQPPVGETPTPAAPG